MSLQRNSINLDISGKEPYRQGGSRFGGPPDIPEGFEWPRFSSGEGCPAVPLSFIAQFDCSVLRQYDDDHMLPDHGVLSFFYETDSMRWGYSPADAGCARVFWFEDASVLSEGCFPDDLPLGRRYPMLHIGMQKLPSFPDPEDCYEFGLVQEGNPCSEENTGSKLLGWPDIIQGSMALECELISRRLFLGNGWDDIPEWEITEARNHADRWLLLFQLDMVETEDFSLMFGDCGRIYFFLPAEDLLAWRFGNAWLMLQCY